MVADFRRDPLTRDLVVANGNAIVRGREAVAQMIGTRLRAWLEEWPYNLDYGAIDRETLLRKAPDLSAIRAFRVRAISTVAGVRRVTSYEPTFDRAAGRLRETVEVLTDDGSTVTVTT